MADEIQPALPFEIIAMIAEYDIKPWRYVNKWYTCRQLRSLEDTIARHEATFKSIIPSITPLTHGELLRIFINMCKYPVFDGDLIVRVIRMILKRSSSSTWVIFFMAVGYHQAIHIVRLIPKFKYEFDQAYGNIHSYLNYNLNDRTYDLRHDLIIEIAITRPNAFDFIANYMTSVYNNRYQDYPTRRLYQFRSCDSIEMGTNMVKLATKNMCVLPIDVVSPDKMLLNAICKHHLDTSGSLEKCIPLLKMQTKPGASTNARSAIYIYEYLATTVIKYSQLL